ncbi:MAG TPA: RNA 2',3'-cyclic phosphodiesterase [Vicinamibacteria bacterium]|nr:RNA 2',3'-cyclic phosphodiesterase [Vicinamibacteria bacterium]
MTADPPPREKAIRAFVALPLPDTLRRAVAETIRRLKPSLPGLRFVRDEGAHVTLRFLGWTRADTIAALEAPLRAAAAACPPLDLAVRGLGTFPERGRPRVLWLGLEVPRAAAALQAACERTAVAAGFEPETRAFHPHLTLGRWGDRARRLPLPDVDLGSAQVGALVLYRSELRPSGSVYTPLAVFPLGGAAAPVG